MSRGKNRGARAKELSESWGSVSYGEEDQDLGLSSSQDSDSPYFKDIQRIKRASANINSTPLGSPAAARQPSNDSTYSVPTTPAQRRPPRRTSSVEPEFVMPSPEGSWGGSPRSTPRVSRRAPQVIEEEDDSPHVRQRRSRPMQRVPPPRDTPSDSQSPWGVLSPILGFVLSVFGGALNVLKPIISLVVAAAMVLGVLTVAKTYLTATVYTALTPICAVPGVSYLNLPFCVYPPHKGAGPVEFDSLVDAQSAFGDILSSSSKGETLQAEMKQSEQAIRDLRTVVHFSHLPSKNELEFEFSGFIETAQQASRDLSTFNMRIGRAVDTILSTNKWTLQVIDSVADREAGRGSIDRFVWDTLLWPISSRRSSRDMLVTQYLRHTRIIEDEIAKLVVQAQTLLGTMESMDERLDAIHKIAYRDDITAREKREELFAYLWTKLGGNRYDVAKLEAQIRLLQNVHKYRKTAVDHISTTMLKLQDIGASLEDLRERCAAPELDSEGPITLHIEHIERGLERLEAQRLDQRQEQDKERRKILDSDGGGRGMPDDRMIEGEKSWRL